MHRSIHTICFFDGFLGEAELFEPASLQSGATEAEDQYLRVLPRRVASSFNGTSRDAHAL